MWFPGSLILHVGLTRGGLGLQAECSCSRYDVSDGGGTAEPHHLWANWQLCALNKNPCDARLGGSSSLSAALCIFISFQENFLVFSWTEEMSVEFSRRASDHEANPRVLLKSLPLKTLLLVFLWNIKVLYYSAYIKYEL